MTTLQIYKNPGQLPTFWDDSVIFFANILSLFYGNEEERQALIDKVGTLETYGSRLIPILNLLYRGRDNLLVLERSPEGTLNNYFVHDLKLSLPQIKVIPNKLYQALGDPNQYDTLDVQTIFHEFEQSTETLFDGYVVDRVINCLSEKLNKKTVSLIGGSHRGNDKLLLYDHIRAMHLPSFDTHIATEIDEIVEQFEDLKQKGYSYVVVKSAIGASGIGLLRFDLSQPFSVDQIPDYIFFEGPVLVQGWLNESVDGVEYVKSPSVQLFVREDAVYLYDVTDQILSDESVHQGNIAPAQFFHEEEYIYEELLDQAQEAAKWLHGQGYRGTGSVDFHVCRRYGKMEVRICEINARVTGATYPSILARHFAPMDAWLMRNIVFAKEVYGKDILAVLDERHLLYRPGCDEGVLPFNFNTDDNGVVKKGQFLFLAKTQDEVLKQLEKMCLIESIQGSFDRD